MFKSLSFSKEKTTSQHSTSQQLILIQIVCDQHGPLGRSPPPPPPRQKYLKNVKKVKKTTKSAILMKICNTLL